MNTEIIGYLTFEHSDAGIFGNALSSNPAVRDDIFLYNNVLTEYKFNDDKREMTSVMMLPDTLITKPYGDYKIKTVYNVEDTRLMMQQFSKRHLNSTLNIDHNADLTVDTFNEKGEPLVYMFESYQLNENIEDKRFKDLNGTNAWIATYKVEDDNIWELAKSKFFKGFSVELLSAVKFDANTADKMIDNELNKMNTIINNNDLSEEVKYMKINEIEEFITRISKSIIDENVQNKFNI